MVTFQTVGDPLVQLRHYGNGKTADLWVTETLDPDYPCISIMRGTYEHEDDADLRTLATLRICEPDGREKGLLQYASIPVSVAARNNVPKNPTVGHLLTHHEDILINKDGTGAEGWRPYSLWVSLRQYAIQYYNAMLGGTGTIQLNGGNLLVEDGDRCLVLHRHINSKTGAPMLQLDFTDNADGCVAITVSKEDDNTVVCRCYENIPDDTSEIMKRVLGPRYNYRALRF